MKQVSYITMMAIALCVQFTVSAQDDSTKSKTQFKLGLYYNSHLHYYGRTDSLRSSGVFPMAELWFNENVYINAAPVFVNNAQRRFQYAGTIATAGYMFNDHKRWAGNFYLVKPFYQSNTQLVQSALKAQAVGTLTLQTKILNITGGGDIKLSDKLDYGATTALDHIFRFELPGKSILVLDPTATMNAGTQQFTNTYFKKSDFLFFPGPDQLVSEQVKKFNVLSYEVSMPVIFAKGKLQLLAIPAYVIPQNLTGNERGENLFYATLGAKVIF